MEIDAAAVQVLLDKQAIHEVLMRYCRGADRADAEMIASAYHPDAVDEHGFFRATGAELADRVRHGGGRGRFKSTTHLLGNELIDVDGDDATGESYFVAWHRYDEDGADYDFVLAGRYLDRYQRRAGEWRISERRVVYDWGRCDPVTMAWPSGVTAPDELVWGRRSGDDPVYSLR